MINIQGSIPSTVIIDSKHHQELVYSDIAPLWGINIVKFLNETLEGGNLFKWYQ
jgi:hypothetical protein